MVGGTLSKWTISFFASAIAWLIAAEMLMAAGFGFPVADLGAPDSLALVHVIALGWLSMAMCGALFQFVPVLVAKPLFSERLTLPVLILLNAGLACLIAGFLALGGRLPPCLWLLPTGAVLLLAGFAVMTPNLALTLRAAWPLAGPARFAAAGLVSAVVAAVLGAIFALVLTLPAAAPLAPVLQAGVPLHAIAGLGGWLTLTAMGVSYRLLSMFMLSPDIDERRSHRALWAGCASLAVGLCGGSLAISALTDWDHVLPLVAITALLTCALYGRDVVALYRSRKRRKLELNMRAAILAFVSLAAAAVLGVVLAATGRFVAEIGAFTFLVAFGWLSGLVLTMLYKIIAFLTWLETYGPVMGRTPTPRVQDLVAERRAQKWFVAYFVAVWSATALLLLQHPDAFRAAVLIMMITTLGILHELVRVRRLADVEAPRRLPQGATLPHLLLSRS